MNSQIVGFVLSPQKIDYTLAINPLLKTKEIVVNGGILVLYYRGDVDQCLINNHCYSLAFPATISLLTHNLVITLDKNHVTVENDWLGSIPLFYNKKERIISTFSSACLRLNKQYDDEGLYHYLKYGFSVFGRTAFQDVQFAMFNSTVTFSPSGIEVKTKDIDPVVDIDAYHGASEDDIWAHLDGQIQQYESVAKGQLVIPTSAGYDSRMINNFVHERQRVQNFSYGISNKQDKSFEVIEAKKLSERLGHAWHQAKLNHAFDYINEWHSLFGFSTHLHGMYHIEMYKNVKETLGDGDLTVISGICGGYISGSVPYSPIDSPKEVYKLALSHGLRYGPDATFENSSLEQRFFEEYRYLFNDIRLYPIINMRIKLTLLSYLISIPSAMGLPTWTPYLDFDLAMKMLCLPAHRRNDRYWVKEFFTKNNLSPQKSILLHDTKNRVNYNLHINHSFAPIKVDFGSTYINAKRVQHINETLGEMNLSTKLNYKLMTTRFIKEVAKKMKIEDKFNTSLAAYQTLKALELSIVK